jgi:hypothetical protein
MLKDKSLTKRHWFPIPSGYYWYRQSIFEPFELHWIPGAFNFCPDLLTHRDNKEEYPFAVRGDAGSTIIKIVIG